jgi:ABC-2 type transport system ATP-binding protein
VSPVIELEGLGVHLGGRPILHDLTVRLERPAVGLLGPNGAGKTTLIHALLGFHPPSAGTARVLGHDIRRPGALAAIRGAVGYMPERDAFLGDMSAIRQVRMLAELSGLPPTRALERAHEALIAVGLGEARYRAVRTYSLGMKQRVKLAQAIAHGPRLLFLDEPTNCLDPAGRARMIRLIQDIRDSGVAIVLSSHLLHDVEQVCDEVVVLKEGRLALHSDLAVARRTNRSFLEVEVRGDRGAFARALAGRGCEVALHGAWRLKVVLPDGLTMRELYAAAAGVQIRRLTYRRHSLEDVFLAAMGVPVGLPGDPSEGSLQDGPVAAGEDVREDGGAAWPDGPPGVAFDEAHAGRGGRA